MPCLACSVTFSSNVDGLSSSVDPSKGLEPALNETNFLIFSGESVPKNYKHAQSYIIYKTIMHHF